MKNKNFENFFDRVLQDFFRQASWLMIEKFILFQDFFYSHSLWQQKCSPELLEVEGFLGQRSAAGLSNTVKLEKKGISCSFREILPQVKCIFQQWIIPRQWGVPLGWDILLKGIFQKRPFGKLGKILSWSFPKQGAAAGLLKWMEQGKEGISCSFRGLFSQVKCIFKKWVILQQWGVPLGWDILLKGIFQKRPFGKFGKILSWCFSKQWAAAGLSKRVKREVVVWPFANEKVGFFGAVWDSWRDFFGTFFLIKKNLTQPISFKTKVFFAKDRILKWIFPDMGKKIALKFMGF